MKIFHVSERADIKEFVPRIPVNKSTGKSEIPDY